MVKYDKLLIVLAVFIFVSGFLIFFPLPAFNSQKNETKNEGENETIKVGKQIIYDTISFNYNNTDYSYRFIEKVNSYPMEYLLIRKGENFYVFIDDHVGVREIYFLENRSFLCVQYLELKECSETTNITDRILLNYYSYLRSRFFSNEKIDKEKEMVNEFFKKGYLAINKVENKTKNGTKCLAVEYTIDYSNMTVTEATKYGLSLEMPTRFDWSVCMVNSTPIYKSFSYSYQGIRYEYEVFTKEFGKAKDIVVPENLSGDAYSLLLQEIETQQKLANCFATNSVKERDKCVSVFAYRSFLPSACFLAGSEKDVCIARLITFLKNATWCENITDYFIKDGCYIELATALKNSSYCSYLVNASAIDICLNVSTPKAENQTPPISEGNQSS